MSLGKDELEALKREPLEDQANRRISLGRSRIYARVHWKNGRINSVPLDTLDLRKFRKSGSRIRRYYVEL